MAKKKRVSWGSFGVYTKLPNRKKLLLTKEFLQTFKDEIVALSVTYDIEHGRSPVGDYANYSYSGYYSALDGTGLFFDALKKACEKHNVTKAIYDYGYKMPWYASDCFHADLVYEMVKKGVIDLENKLDDEMREAMKEQLKDKYKLVKHLKDYTVMKFDDWYEGGREDLEQIYENSAWQVVWLES